MWPRSELSSDFVDNSDLNQEIGEVLIAPAFLSISVEGNICCVIDCEMYSSFEKIVKGCMFYEEICSKCEGELLDVVNA